MEQPIYYSKSEYIETVRTTLVSFEKSGLRLQLGHWQQSLAESDHRWSSEYHLGW